ncbi:MAG: STAS domain-containing protein [Candidatus Hydrogenedentes bacterium]|nr:STAS domain-containing protein [Candidatus Hydrogenedentota bacterium]
MAERKRVLVEFKRAGRITVATVRSSSVLSALNVAEFGNQMLRHVKGKRGINLLLSLENVDYLSSAVLTELLRINKAVQELEGRFRICAVAPNIREIFQITNLDKLFVLNEDDAKANIKRFERSLDIAAQDAAWHEPAAEADE